MIWDREYALGRNDTPGPHRAPPRTDPRQNLAGVALPLPRRLQYARPRIGQPLRIVERRSDRAAVQHVPRHPVAMGRLVHRLFQRQLRLGWKLFQRIRRTAWSGSAATSDTTSCAASLVDAHLDRGVQQPRVRTCRATRTTGP